MVYKIYHTENSSQIVSLKNCSKVHKPITILSYSSEASKFIFWKPLKKMGYSQEQSYFVYNFLNICTVA